MADWLANIDRRLIYLLVLLALSVPLVNGYTLPPAEMDDAARFFRAIESVPRKEGSYAFFALDLGPNTQAENGPQAEAAVEHLFRKRIPVLFFSVYMLAEPFLVSIPEKVRDKLEKEMPGEKWEYGRDWVNLGFRPGAATLLQNISKSNDLLGLFKTDSRGNRLEDLPAFAGFRSLDNIAILVQITGLVGVFDTYIQFFKKTPTVPPFVHGCTSITIPEAFIYLDSGQIVGLLGGIGGAAYYSSLLSERYPARKAHPDDSQVINTGLGVAHLIIILLVAVGNLAPLLTRGKPRAVEGQ